MAIEETRKKIHFTAYNPDAPSPVKKEKAPTVVVNRKYNKILFGKKAMAEMDMEGKFIRLYYEPTRKIIGWQLREKVEQHEMKTWKLVRANEQTLSYAIGIKKMLDDMGGRLTAEAYKVPIQKYREMATLDPHSGEIFYFVELVDEVKD